MKKTLNILFIIASIVFIIPQSNNVLALGGGCIDATTVAPPSGGVNFNCPAYASTATSSGKACGNQDYKMIVNNTQCNGEIYFTVSGSGCMDGWRVESTKTGDVLVSDATGNFGPIDVNTQGSIFNLFVDGASAGDYIEVLQEGGNVLAHVAGGNQVFSAAISVSSATMTVQTPSGPVTSKVEQCKNIIMQIPLTNSDFCSSSSISLPWEITCDKSGAVLSSGTHNVTIYPDVPTSANDLVDVTWNSTSCVWDVAGKNDCDLSAVGSVFNISPDPTTLKECGDGTEAFTVTYTGLPNSPQCWKTAGPQTSIKYNKTYNAGGAVQKSSPYGGNGNAAYLNFPPKMSGGKATSFDLCIDVTNFCFNSSDKNYYIAVFIDNAEVQFVGPINGVAHHVCFTLGDLPNGYDQTSNLEVYVLPNRFSSATGVDTKYDLTSCAQNGHWTADVEVTLSVTFEETIGSPVNNTFTLNANYTSCQPAANDASLTKCESGTGNVPFDLTNAEGDINGGSGITYTYYTDVAMTYPIPDPTNFTAADGTKVYVKVSNGNASCTSSAIITLNITPQPSFTVKGEDPTSCSSADGKIIINGLTNNTAYEVTYSDNGTSVGPASHTSDNNGTIEIPVGAGTYTDFTISIAGGCPVTITTVIKLTTPAAPKVTATGGTICKGESIIIKASGTPTGGQYTWNKGAGSGSEVTVSPATTTTYEVTYKQNGCDVTATAEVIVTPKATPTFDPIAPICEGTSFTLPSKSKENISGTWSPAINSTTTTTYTFKPDAGQCAQSTDLTVTVNSGPTFTVTGTKPTTCSSTDATILISGLDPNTTYNVGYEKDGNTIVPVALISNGSGEIEIPNLGPGTYSNVTVGIGGCSRIDITVLNLFSSSAPTVDAGSNQEVCEGEEITLTATNPGGATISWDKGVVDGIAFEPPVGKTTYTVTANKNGCSATDVVEITVHAIPTVNAGSDLTICVGDQVTLSASGADTYTWNNGVIDGQSFAPQKTTTYTVTGETAGCEDNDEVVVTVLTPANLDFEVDTAMGCTPLTVEFTSLSGTTGLCQYTLSDGTVLNSCNPTHTFTQSGCYDVTLLVKSKQGCSSSITKKDFICVDSNPIASFTANPSEIGGMINNEVEFTNTSKGAKKYIWFFGDGMTGTATNPTHVYDLEVNNNVDKFIVTLIAYSEQNCTDTISTVLPVVEDLIYYIPNSFTPNGDGSNETFKPIFTSGFDPLNYHLTIFNKWGETVYESYDSNYGWDGTYGGKVVQDGIYIWKIKFKVKRHDEHKTIMGHVSIIR